MNDNKTKFPKINVEILSMNDPVIFSENGSLNLGVQGKLNISYDEDIYFPVVLDGYCLDENNVRYNIYGPSPGAISFYNTDKEYFLGNTINSQDGDVVYPDGTRKSSLKVDWHDVVIKSCKIEKVVAYISETDETGLASMDTTVETEINYEKIF